MPDTFQSWFVVIELHLWILSARLMAEGKEGKALRDSVFAAMWEDVRARAKTIHVSLKSIFMESLLKDLYQKYEKLGRFSK